MRHYFGPWKVDLGDLVSSRFAAIENGIMSHLKIQDVIRLSKTYRKLHYMFVSLLHRQFDIGKYLRKFFDNDARVQAFRTLHASAKFESLDH